MAAWARRRRCWGRGVDGVWTRWTVVSFVEVGWTEGEDIQTSAQGGL